MPEFGFDEYTLELAGREGDRPIHEGPGEGGRRANPSKCWHFVYRTGWAIGRYACRPEGRYVLYDFPGTRRMLSGVKIAIAGSNALVCRNKKYAPIKSFPVAQAAR
jgi:hypothetical protein